MVLHRQVGRRIFQLLAAAGLLTLAAAPFGQWYLAWFGLAFWLIAVAESPTSRQAMLRGWLGGVLYFSMNIWWLWTASIPGTVVLVLYFSLYWGAAAGLLHRSGLLRTTVAIDGLSRSYDGTLGAKLSPVGCVLGVATTWVAFEWLRLNVVDGFPWLSLGVTQTPLPVMCQVADWGGPAIISFWVALLNAFVTMAWIHRRELARVKPAAAFVSCATTRIRTAIRSLPISV